ncbi:hypothetical protein O181_086733 [Austropuccinia psidii MF-1]|uniref:Uncharacterized protein n=1 Tax=Austropuccinia psidii MF-1 TaxID=1389203 RepID=A0A9Q3FZS8_9BASI|nr:hypothetical protein [Austropuccinia psidii MF-1]
MISYTNFQGSGRRRSLQRQALASSDTGTTLYDHTPRRWIDNPSAPLPYRYDPVKRPTPLPQHCQPGPKAKGKIICRDGRHPQPHRDECLPTQSHHTNQTAPTDAPGA